MRRKLFLALGLAAFLGTLYVLDGGQGAREPGGLSPTEDGILERSSLDPELGTEPRSLPGGSPEGPGRSPIPADLSDPSLVLVTVERAGTDLPVEHFVVQCACGAQLDGRGGQLLMPTSHGTCEGGTFCLADGFRPARLPALASEDDPNHGIHVALDPRIELLLITQDADGTAWAPPGIWIEVDGPGAPAGGRLWLEPAPSGRLPLRCRPGEALIIDWGAFRTHHPVPEAGGRLLVRKPPGHATEVHVLDADSGDGIAGLRITSFASSERGAGVALLTDTEGKLAGLPELAGSRMTLPPGYRPLRVQDLETGEPVEHTVYPDGRVRSIDFPEARGGRVHSKVAISLALPPVLRIEATASTPSLLEAHALVYLQRRAPQPLGQTEERWQTWGATHHVHLEGGVAEVAIRDSSPAKGTRLVVQVDGAEPVFRDWPGFQALQLRRVHVTLEAHPATEVALIDSFGNPFPYRVRVDQAELGYHTSSRDLLGLQTLSVPEGLDLRTADWRAEGWSNRDHPLLLDRPDDLGQDSWNGTEVVRRHLVVRTGLVRIPGEGPLPIGFCDEEGYFFAEGADLEGSSTLLPPGAYWYGPEDELLTLAWSVKPNDWTGRRKVLPSEVRHPLVTVEAGEVVVLPPIDRDEPGFRLSLDVRTFLPEHLFVDFGDDPEGARAPRGMLPTALEVNDEVELVLDPAVGVPTWAMACIARVDSRGLRTPLWFEPSFDGAALHIDPGWITFEGGTPPDGTTLTLVRDDDESERGSVLDARTIAAFLEGTDRLEVPPGSYTFRDSRAPRVRRELVVRPGQATPFSLTHPDGQD